MQFVKKAIIVFLTCFFWLLNRLKRFIQFDTFANLWRYAKWKARLKHLGKNVTFYRAVVIHGCDNVSIGTGTCIAEYVHMWGGGQIDIGENVLMAAHAVIASQTHDNKANIYKHSMVYKKVCIEDNVWVGTHAIILPGITIGRNAIIGAGAVVTKDVPANDIVVGVPARSIRTDQIIAESDGRKDLINTSELSDLEQ